MQTWEQIQKTIDYIDEHLGEQIEIESLARLACLSPFYYQRVFSRLVRKPVGEYIKLRRMGKATELLRRKDIRILDVALELGFATHEHFTRTFKGTFGITPNEYRTTDKMFNYMTKPELALQYTLMDEGVPLITEGIVLEVNRREIGEPVSFTGLSKKMPVQFIDGLGNKSGEDELAVLWQTIHEMRREAGIQSVNEEGIGVTLPCQEEGHFHYFAGWKSEALKTAEDYQVWELPAGRYAVCTFEAESFAGLVTDALYKALQYLYGVWLPGHHLTTEAFCAERYASHNSDTTSMEIWMKIAE